MSSSLHIKLTPKYDLDHGTVSSVPIGIQVGMSIQVPDTRLQLGSPLLTLLLKRGDTPTARYDGDALFARDDVGDHLGLRAEDLNNKRTWYLTRQPLSGRVTVDFFAPSRKTDKNTKPSSRFDLRRDPGGGLVGKGMGFIPVMPEDGGQAESWKVTVEWEVRDAPKGTRGAWSLGDSVTSHATGSLQTLISSAIFAVGQMTRYPPWDEGEAGLRQDQCGKTLSHFSIYWFGSTIYDMDTLPSMAARICRSIMSFFSSSKPFRVFLREVESGHGGSGSTDSFLLEYSQEAASQRTTQEIAELLAHETIHAFAMPEADGVREGEQAPEAAWYAEGVANFYGAIAAYKGGATSREALISCLNGYAQSYYTSPEVGTGYRQILRRYWDTVHTARVSYYRGFMYLAAENGRIAAATKGNKSFDDIALELYHRRIHGERHRLEEYHAMVAGAIGGEEEGRNYEAMMRGELIVPRADCFGEFGIKMIRQDAERFELGFTTSSLRRDEVQGLVPGSRAEAAGVREGDQIITSWMAWDAANRLSNLMQITVFRDGEEKVISWCPRSYEKVECWQWVDADHN